MRETEIKEERERLVEWDEEEAAGREGGIGEGETPAGVHVLPHHTHMGAYGLLTILDQSHATPDQQNYSAPVSHMLHLLCTTHLLNRAGSHALGTMRRQNF